MSAYKCGHFKNHDPENPSHTLDSRFQISLNKMAFLSFGSSHYSLYIQYSFWPPQLLSNGHFNLHLFSNNFVLIHVAGHMKLRPLEDT